MAKLRILQIKPNLHINLNKCINVLLIRIIVFEFICNYMQHDLIYNISFFLPIINKTCQTFHMCVPYLLYRVKLWIIEIP